MKSNELFNPDIKSKDFSKDLIFRLVDFKDRDVVSHLMLMRNPQMDVKLIYEKTEREIILSINDAHYRLFVAEIEREVVGFCRHCHSKILSDDKKTFPAPEGWYGLGIMVDPNKRRQGVAQFLSLNRFKILRESGASEFYSAVDSGNHSSIQMHRKFGFHEVSRAEGFLHIKFESGEGLLFRNKIDLNNGIDKKK